MSRKWMLRLFVMVIGVLSLTLITSAQGGDLPADALILDNYSGSPIIYTFTGNENEVVTLYAIGSGGLRPTLALSSSNGQPVAFGSADALTPMSNDTRVTARLPQTDTYIVTLSSLEGTVGSYSLIRTVTPAIVATPVTDSQVITIEPNTPAQSFSVAANPSASQQITLINADPASSFTAQVQTADGTVLASIAGGLDTISLTIPASSVETIITIGAPTPEAGASVQLTVGDGSGTSAVAPTTNPPADPNQCTVVGNNVNLRSGPGTNYDIVGGLNADNQLIATGQNNGWYYGIYNGIPSWVAASIVTATGNCSNLSFVDAPAVPAVPPPQTTEEVSETSQAQATQAEPTQATDTTQATTTAPTATTAAPTATTAPFEVVSFSCTYALNDGATIRFNVTGPPSATFLVEARFGSTTYSVQRTLNDQGFLNANQRIGQVGNSNYRAYLVYNGQDVANTDC